MSALSKQSNMVTLFMAALAMVSDSIHLLWIQILLQSDLCVF